MGTLAVAGQKVPASFPNQYYSMSDTTATPVTAASHVNLTTPYTIDANQPLVNSAYRIEFQGTGTWGSTQQLLGFELNVGGVIICNNLQGIAAAAFSASAGIRFTGYAEFTFSAVGVGGGVYGSYFVCVTQIANVVLPGTVTQNTVPIADSNAAAAAVDTTAAMSAVVKAGWGGTTGAPTITNRRTRFAKVA